MNAFVFRSWISFSNIQTILKKKKNNKQKLPTFHIAGAAAASRVFNEALAKIAMNAQHGGTTDIGKDFNQCLLTFKHQFYDRFSIRKVIVSM